ncbi:MAG: M14 family metallopeptidase [Gemmatimonadota bacterium]
MRLLRLLVLAVLVFPGAVTAQHALDGEGPYDPAVPTPASVLGYELGEAFTPHHAVVRYLGALAETSDRVRLDTVATTYEGRPLLLVTITSAANQARLDELQAGARRLADPRGASTAELERLVAEQPTVVWLGYTVHGNEASGVEAALGTAYELAAGQDDGTLEILENVITLIDPVQNPDGHDRHVYQVAWDLGRFGPDENPAAMVHGHDWHGARSNHYLFDLNRDWIVHAQRETRARMDVFRSWYPHVAADLHEMGSSSTYFFPPPMKPVNVNIHPTVAEGWEMFARGNAAAFADEGWGFFTREAFDEFFPGYGPSWPIYTGAVGMTYEQASSAGGAIRRDDGTVLTLLEAARHHYTASRATLRTAATNRATRVAGYLESRQAPVVNNGVSGIRSVFIARDAQGRADSLVTVLLRHGIEVSRLDEARRVRATEYGARDAGRVTIPAGSYVVDLAQPQGILARTILDPDPRFEEGFIEEELARREAGLRGRFYDMTGWALPFLFRVPAWHSEQAVEPVTAVRSVAPVGAPLPDRAGYAYAFAPGSEASLRMLAGLFTDDIRVRHAPRAFRIGDASFPHGAFLVLVHRNRGQDDGASLHETVRARAAESGAEVVALHTALVDEGTDLGSNSVRAIPDPAVALVGGDGISSTSFGAAWYALDQLLHFPATRVELSRLTRSLDEFNVVILPSTWSLGSTLGERGTQALRDWVRGGGTLITLDGATRWLASDDGLARIRTRSLDEPLEPEAEESAGRPLRASIPGAILRATVDTLSPLAAGIHEPEIPVMLFDGTVYETPDGAAPGEAVIRYAPEDRLRLSGFLWPESPPRIAGATYLWTERVGSGRVIAFTGDPNFRAMWRGLLPLFGHAIFLGGTF